MSPEVMTVNVTESRRGGCLRRVILSTIGRQQMACNGLGVGELCDRCGPGDEVIKPALALAFDWKAAIPRRNASLASYPVGRRIIPID